MIHGQEKEEWMSLKNQLELMDLGNIGDFSWQNYSHDPLARKARLDRAYGTSTWINQFLNAECAINKSTTLLDRYPIRITVENIEKKYKNKLFIINRSLLGIPTVNKEIEKT